VRATTPLHPEADVEFTVSMSVTRWISCHDADRTERCVEAHYAAAARREDIQRLLRRSGAPEEMFQSVAVGTDAVLVTEPGKLLPRSLVVVKSSRVPVAHQGTWTMEESVDRTEYRFLWASDDPRAKR
jgi:hypothetical protein